MLLRKPKLGNMNPVAYLLSQQGKTIGITQEESVREAGYAVDHGEPVNYALLADFVFENKTYHGVVVVTAYRLICCTSVRHNSLTVSLPFFASFEFGNIKGFIHKELSVRCDKIDVIIKAPSPDLDQLCHMISGALYAHPGKFAINYEPWVGRQSAEEYQRIQKIKDDFKNTRSLSKTEAAAYGNCPQCGCKTLIERKRKIYCAKCNYNFRPIK